MNFAATPRAIPGYAPGIWTSDAEASEIAFSVRMLGLKTRGRFARFEATIQTGPTLLESTVAATIHLASIDTKNQKRDEHVRGEEYLKVAEHPVATYTSRRLRRDGDRLVVEGDLTLHGAVSPVELIVADIDLTDPGALRRRATFTASAVLSRRAFGLRFPMDGGHVVSDKVSVALRMEALLEPEGPGRAASRGVANRR